MIVIMMYNKENGNDNKNRNDNNDSDTNIYVFIQDTKTLANHHYH